MKKETQNIATNMSSGAEKVEKIEKKAEKTAPKSGKSAPKTVKKQTTAKKTTVQAAKGDAALGDSKASAKETIDVKKVNAQSTAGKAEAESAAAKARVQAALKKKEEKERKKAERDEKAASKKAERQKRMAEKKAEIEKRNAAKKALIAKRIAEKKAKAQKRAAARKALAEKRAAEKAEKAARKKAQHAQKENGQKRSSARNKNRNRDNRNHRERREKGYGGWIAAVVTLGVTTLALAATSTVGAIEMSRATDDMMTAYKGTMYELTGILENVENDLDRVRVSDSTAQQSRILTDLLVQSRLAELDIEKMPVASEADRNITSFVNRTASICEAMLAKLRNGGSLSEKDREILEGLYQTNYAIREELNQFIGKMKDGDISEYIKKGKGGVADMLDKVEKLTLEENRPTFGDMKPRDGKDMTEGKDAKSGGEEMPKIKEMPSKIEAARAEELCLQYFKSYDVAEYRCVGETVTKTYAAYNVQGYDENGSMLFAEIDQTSGKLVRFDYYEECADETFDLQNAERIAEAFLEGLGYEDMEIVRCRQNGTTADFTFVYEDDGVAYYPDEIRVKVCRTRGVVSGMDASKYLQNHRDRGALNVRISLAQAYEKLYKGLDVESSRLTVVKTARGERAAYEMLCGYGEDRYLIYLDAANGEEISIINVNTIQ